MDKIVAAESRLLPGVGTAAGGRWPTKLRRKLAGATTTAAKETAEADEVKRWGAELLELATDAKLPVVLRLRGTDHEGLITKM